MRRTCCILLLLLLGGCGTPNPPVDSADGFINSDYVQIKRAVYQELIPNDTLTPSVDTNWVCFLGGSPEELAEYQRAIPTLAIRGHSHEYMADPSGRQGITDKETGRPGISCDVNVWEIGRTNALAMFSYYAASLAAGNLEVRLEKKNGKWIVIQKTRRRQS